MVMRSIAKVSLLAAVVAARGNTEGTLPAVDKAVDLKITTSVEGDQVSSNIDLKKTGDLSNTNSNDSPSYIDEENDGCCSTEQKIADCSITTVLTTAVVALTVGYFCENGCGDCTGEGSDDNSTEDNSVKKSDEDNNSDNKDSIIPTSDAVAEAVEKFVDYVNGNTKNTENFEDVENSAQNDTADHDASKTEAAPSSTFTTILISALAGCVVLLAVLLAMTGSKKDGVYRVNSGHDMLTGSKAKDGVMATNVGYHDFLEKEEEADVREGLIVHEEA